MRTERIERSGYTMIYNVYEAGFTTRRVLSKYSLHEGYMVWRVEAALKRNMKTQFYHVVEVNSASAVNKFLTIHPRFSAIRSVKLLNAEDATAVLNQPTRYRLW